MAKLSKALILSTIGLAVADTNVKKSDRNRIRQRPEPDIRNPGNRAEEYWSESTCSGRSVLEDFMGDVCCWTKSDFYDCAGCNPNLSSPCWLQGVLQTLEVYDYVDGEYVYYENIRSRDCFCDAFCKSRGDCCDDFQETCPSFFTPRQSIDVQFTRGTKKIFRAGVGKTFAEAQALCKDNGAVIFRPETEADIDVLRDTLVLENAYKSEIWLPYVHLNDNNEITPPNSAEDYDFEWKWCDNDNNCHEVNNEIKNKYLKIEQKGGKLHGMGTGCTKYYTNKEFDWRGRLRYDEAFIWDAVCEGKSMVFCEETGEADETANPPVGPEPDEQQDQQNQQDQQDETDDSDDNENEADQNEETDQVDETDDNEGDDSADDDSTDDDSAEDDSTDDDSTDDDSTADESSDEDSFEEVEIDHEMLWQLISESALGLQYRENLLCEGDNAASNADIAEHFDGVCPSKTEKVHKAIIKQLDAFMKKINKEAGKLFDFNHKFCAHPFVFTSRYVNFNRIDFTSIDSMKVGMDEIEQEWKDAIQAQLGNHESEKCEKFINKNQASVGKIIRWAGDVTKKVVLNRNNLQDKQITTLGKEVAKAIRDARRAAQQG